MEFNSIQRKDGQNNNKLQKQRIILFNQENTSLSSYQCNDLGCISQNDFDDN
jgi:hypothetical protein